MVKAVQKETKDQPKDLNSRRITCQAPPLPLCPKKMKGRCYRLFNREAVFLPFCCFVNNRLNLSPMCLSNMVK